jgi:hypothetical protein
MSVGDWFTLKPLNIMSRQEIDNDLNDIRLRLTTLEGNVNFLIDSEAQDRQDIININLQLQQLQGLPGQVNNLQNQVNDIDARLTSLDNRVDPLFGTINNLELLYKKIDEYTLTNLRFSQALYSTFGSLQVTWYQPLKLVDGGGTDLKFLIMVVCGFTINLVENVTRYGSFQLDLPIPRVNNNDLKSNMH